MPRIWHWDDVDDDRDQGPPDRSFVCSACEDELDEHELVVLTRHPETPCVCLNCACG